MPSPITVANIATTISAAPAWAIINLSMPDQQLREAGAAELARWIVEAIDPQPAADARQLALALPVNV